MGLSNWKYSILRFVGTQEENVFDEYKLYSHLDQQGELDASGTSESRRIFLFADPDGPANCAGVRWPVYPCQQYARTACSGRMYRDGGNSPLSLPWRMQRPVHTKLVQGLTEGTDFGRLADRGKEAHERVRVRIKKIRDGGRVSKDECHNPHRRVRRRDPADWVEEVGEGGDE